MIIDVDMNLIYSALTSWIKCSIALEAVRFNQTRRCKSVVSAQTVICTIWSICSGRFYLGLDHSWSVFKIEVLNALQTRLAPSKHTSLSKQPFKTQPQTENEDVTWSPQYNLSTTRTNNRRALSLQEVELDGWFTILHIVLEACTM